MDDREETLPVTPVASPQPQSAVILPEEQSGIPVQGSVATPLSGTPLAAAEHVNGGPAPLAAGAAAVSAPAPASAPAGPSAAQTVADLPGTEEAAGPSIRLEEKHPRAIRWMHWVNFPVLFTMIWSGLIIYWGDSDNAYLHPHRVYRIGVGSWTLFRFFPEWVYVKLNAPYRITTGLGYHFFFMWIFGINGLIYVTYLWLSGEWRLLVPTMKSWREAIQVTLYDLHLSRVHPPVRKYNGAQKIAYTAIIVMGAGSLITGLAIYKPTQTHLITSLLGGYEMARWEHFWLTIGFMLFFLLHVGQVIKTGWNNFRGMVTGYEIRPVDQPLYVEERRGQ